MLHVLLALLLAQAAAGTPPPPADVRLLKPSDGIVLAEIDTTRIGGDPVGLAWNSDGTIYLRVTRGKETRHYQIATRPALSVGQSDDTPDWAATYWAWKAGIVAPGDPSLRLDVEQRTEQRSTRAAGAELAGMSGGVLPGGGGEGETLAGAIDAANRSVKNQTVTLRLKGKVVAEWSNEVPQPGMRFGWAPSPMAMLAFVDAQGRVVLIDREGRTTRLPGVSKALLPAWSTDGKQVLCLQKKSGGLYLLTVTSLGQ